MPLCAYIGGAAPHFTEKGHVFRPGETVRKQLVILNDTREAATCKYVWSCAAIDAQGKGEIAVPAGEKQFVEVNARCRRDFKPGQYRLTPRLTSAPAAGKKTRW